MFNISLVSSRFPAVKPLILASGRVVFKAFHFLKHLTMADPGGGDGDGGLGGCNPSPLWAAQRKAKTGQKLCTPFSKTLDPPRHNHCV